MRLWFNETWRGTYQLIGLLRDGAAADGRALDVLGSHRIPSTPFLQACDRVLAEPGGTGDAYARAALALCRRHAVDVFVPTREMHAVALREADFAAAGVRVQVSPAAGIATLAGKTTTYAAAAALGIPVPATRTVTSAAGFAAAVDALTAAGHRVCVKPDLDHGGRGFRVLDDDAARLDALFAEPTVAITRAAYEDLLRERAQVPALVVGEYLDEPEYSVDCVSDPGGRLVAAVTRGKSGLPWTREIVDVPAVTAIARAAVEGFGLRYLSNVQVRHRGDEPVLLEVNTRAASGTYQSAAADVNLPYLALRLVLGERVEAPVVRSGATLITYNEAIPFER